MAVTNNEYQVIGTCPVRPDGVDKVTGRARYGADTKLSGLLQGVVLRSPHPHAKINSIDTSKAEALEGVHAVITSEDFPEPGDRIAELGEGAVKLRYLSANVMARGKANYKGQPVAAVAADDIHIAEEAAALIQVDYTVLPHVLDVREAMADDAPILDEELRTAELTGDEGDKPTNVAAHIRFEKGDVEKGFAEASTIVECEYDTATVHQGYIEPQASTAHWRADGFVTIWTCTQGSFTVRQQVAELLQIPLSHVKVVPTEIGGGFGGKISVYTEPLAAALSRKAGAPVKVVMKRADVFQSTGPTAGSYVRVKLGADAEGRLTAAQAYVAFEAGGFPGALIGAGCMCIFASYDVPNGLIDGYDVSVNKPKSSAYRAPGATNVAFAADSAIDELCEKLKMDPIEFRLKNAAKEGTRRVDDAVFQRVGLVETIEAIRDSEHWKTPLEGPNRGRGIASGFWFNAGLKSAASATVNGDGSVSLVEGSTDIGGSRASLAMMLAETLGIGVDEVNPTVADTDSVGYTDVTGGSRVTFATGIAVHEAGLDIQRQMVSAAGAIWDVDPETVRYENGTIVGPEGKSFSFEELAEENTKTGNPITGRGASAAANQAGAFGTHAVDVEVDPDTGKVTILRYTAAQDVGTAIHPDYVEGQIQGGVVQGIGWALNEEYFYGDDGVMNNASFLDYRIPTFCDVPMIETIMLEVPDPNHPFGVRGVGEVPIVPPPAALANAIYDAVGVRMGELPMSPPKVLHEILGKDEASS
ncbi:MAG: oxidoreductase [Planctomycetaceae bacterium]|nr:oxidoreductase [Planctomycetaceae bacterium]